MQKDFVEKRDFKTGKDPLSIFISRHFLLSHFICGMLMGIPFVITLEVISHLLGQ